MKRFTEMVREFNNRAEISYPTKNREFRAKLINEEVAELREAFDIHAKAPTHETLCNLIKEGCDLIYVLCGTILDFGTPNLFDIYDLDDVERSLPRNKPNEYLMEEIEDFCKLFADGGNIGVYYAGAKVSRLLFNFDNSVVEAFTAVHKSNMTKGTNGLPVFVDGKLAKGEDYVKCDLSSIVSKR